MITENEFPKFQKRSNNLREMVKSLMPSIKSKTIYNNGEWVIGRWNCLTEKNQQINSNDQFIVELINSQGKNVFLKVETGGGEFLSCQEFKRGLSENFEGFLWADWWQIMDADGLSPIKNKILACAIINSLRDLKFQGTIKRIINAETRFRQNTFRELCGWDYKIDLEMDDGKVSKKRRVSISFKTDWSIIKREVMNENDILKLKHSSEALIRPEKIKFQNGWQIFKSKESFLEKVPLMPDVLAFAYKTLPPYQAIADVYKVGLKVKENNVLGAIDGFMYKIYVVVAERRNIRRNEEWLIYRDTTYTCDDLTTSIENKEISPKKNRKENVTIEVAEKIEPIIKLRYRTPEPLSSNISIVNIKKGDSVNESLMIKLKRVKDFYVKQNHNISGNENIHHSLLNETKTSFLNKSDLKYPLLNRSSVSHKQNIIEIKPNVITSKVSAALKNILKNNMVKIKGKGIGPSEMHEETFDSFATGLESTFSKTKLPDIKPRIR